VMAAAAAQLGWRGADGSLPCRSVDARDAIEAALAQGVQFVVIDLGSEHALELAGDEVALLLAVKQKQSPKASTTTHGTRAAPQAKGLIDFDLPFVHGRGEAAAAGAPRQEVVAEASEDLLARAFAAPTEDGPGNKGAAAQLPAAAPAPVAAPVVAAAQPAGAWAPIAPAATGAAAQPPPAPPAPRGPAQAQPAEPASSKASAAAQRTMLGHAAPAPKPQVAEDKPSPARHAAKTSAEDSKPSAIKSAARALATMMGGSGEPAPSPEDETSADQDAQAPVFEEGALRPLDLGLSEAALGAIAETLRGFPEVEWACEVSDGTEVPVIGLRVSPQFMTRAAEIEQATFDAGTARGAELRVLLLSDAAVMREARTHGSAFFPWKKRK